MLGNYNAMEKDKQKDSKLKGNWECELGRVRTLNWVVKVGFIEKLRFQKKI